MRDVMDGVISMIHGSGGSATGELIETVFAKAYSNSHISSMEDATVVEGSSRIAVTTDSFVVTPLFYPGGDIGRLSVCGSVNDLLSRGAIPKYLTAAFVIEEGTRVETLREIAGSIADTAGEAGVTVVCGDTKVIEGSGGVVVNTTGIGFVGEGIDISAKGARPGDHIIVSGRLGDHHACILSRRLEVENDIESDNAPLVEMSEKLFSLKVHSMRDVTRGGLATVLFELAASSGRRFVIDETRIPVSDEVRDFCGIMGLDPLYMGNEGKMVFIVAPEDSLAALEAVRSSKYGEYAEDIGIVEESGEKELVVRTSIGGARRLIPLADEGLPRIC